MLTDEEKAGLSEEEIAAMEEEVDDNNSDDTNVDDAGDVDDAGEEQDGDDNSGEDGEGEESEEDDNGDSDAKDDTNDDGEEDNDDSTGDDGSGDDDNNTDDDTGDDNGDQEQEPFDPLKVDMSDAPYVNHMPLKMNPTMDQDLQTRLDNARKEYEDGDKEEAEFEAERRKIETENQNRQAADQYWDEDQRAFLDKFSQYKDDGPLRSALQGEVSRIDKLHHGELSGMQLLMAAKESVEITFGMKQPTTPPVEDAGKGKENGKEDKGKKANNGKEDKGKRPKPKRPAPDTHAVDTASAAANNGNGGEFDHLNGLSGMALESAVAKMTDEQRMRWLDS